MRPANVYGIMIAAAAACMVFAASDSYAEKPPAGKENPGYDANEYIREPGVPEGEGGRTKPVMSKPGKPGGDNVVVPEPGTVALLSLGLAGLAVARRRKKAN